MPIIRPLRLSWAENCTGPSHVISGSHPVFWGYGLRSRDAMNTSRTFSHRLSLPSHIDHWVVTHSALQDCTVSNPYFRGVMLRSEWIREPTESQRSHSEKAEESAVGFPLCVITITSRRPVEKFPFLKVGILVTRGGNSIWRGKLSNGLPCLKRPPGWRAVTSNGLDLTDKIGIQKFAGSPSKRDSVRQKRRPTHSVVPISFGVHSDSLEEAIDPVSRRVPGLHPI